MISFGGGGSDQSSQQQSSQGFRDLPPEIQQSFIDLAQQAQGYLPGNNPNTTSMFQTPQSSLTQQGNAAIAQGFTPTQQQYNQSIAMQQNPYDQYVINEINRQAQGQNSQLQQALNTAGQFGSNRAILGANDIDLSRMNQIGSFLNGEYQNASNNALTTIPQLNAQSAQAQLTAGQANQQYALQQQQAPINALASISSILGVLPTNSGQSSGQSSGSSSQFSGGLFSSDNRLKENIVPLGIENGMPIYEFNYKGDNQKYIGAMADDIEGIIPEAVVLYRGFRMVDYDKIGVQFRRVS